MSAVSEEKAGPVVANATDGTSDSLSNGVDEVKLVRKLDRHIIPLVMLLYTASFLDRVNLGNARLYGLEEDLGLQGNQFQISVSILFVTYLLFEVPSNLVLKKFTPSRWIAFIAVAWGIIATLTGLVQNFGGLIAVRLLLGVFEAGLFPGLNVYLTFFYTKHELALRVGYLFVSAAIAGSLGGLLAYGIGQMDGIQGMSGWRWIMIIEGIPSVALGVATYFLLPNDPDSASFLSEEEKNCQRLKFRSYYGETESSRKFDKKDMIAAFTDWKIYVFSIAQFGVDTMLYGFSTFLPTIIAGMGQWSTAEVQLLTIPCYFLGAIAYMGTAYLSDHMQKRGLFCVIFGTISAVGYGILVSDSSAGVHYFGCFMVAMGLYVVVGLPLAWVRLTPYFVSCSANPQNQLPTNLPRYGKRTTANGMQLTTGNAAGVMVPFIYLKPEGPRYIKGNSVSLAMVFLGTALYGFMWFWYRNENKKRDENPNPPTHEGATEEELAELGDESPHYRFTI